MDPGMVVIKSVNLKVLSVFPPIQNPTSYCCRTDRVIRIFQSVVPNRCEVLRNSNPWIYASNATVSVCMCA